ncbi:hypothetical protein GDO81_027690 [Engystomops pustulosus]|uniref:Metallothionein n=1 Tax=Engystomops pustulosus TaxID=76066 RepID=A0AAV6YJL0_ENGPU|nr:hypothetical protein GDO81_027690 [Engystomops pustulosus]
MAVITTSSPSIILQTLKGCPRENQYFSLSLHISCTHHLLESCQAVGQPSGPHTKHHVATASHSGILGPGCLQAPRKGPSGGCCTCEEDGTGACGGRCGSSVIGL